LSHVQLFLGEDILEALVVGVDLTTVPHKVMSPCLESMDDGGKLESMDDGGKLESRVPE
jgi:hypothetical protein